MSAHLDVAIREMKVKCVFQITPLGLCETISIAEIGKMCLVIPKEARFWTWVAWEERKPSGGGRSLPQAYSPF